MAIETTPLGYQKPDGDELLANGDNVISANAQLSDDLHTESRAQIANLLAAAGFSGDPLQLNDSAVSAAVADADSETNTQLASRGYLREASLKGTYPTTAARLAAVDTRFTTTDADVDKVQANLDAVADAAGSPANGTNGVTVGMVRKPFGVNTRYSAFPWVAKLADGRLLAVWYEGTDHATTRDGVVRASYSSDDGRTWSTAFTAVSMASTDLRDPTVAVSPDGATVYLTYFKGSAALAAAGYFIRTSTDNGQTYGAEVRIDGGQAYAAGCAAVVTLSDGRLLATWYGQQALAEGYDSVWVAFSSNQGATWSAPLKVVSGTTSGMDMQEPCAVVYGSTIVLTYRHGSGANIGVLRSTNNGSSWLTPGTAKFPGSGRPGTVVTRNGTIICVYRGLGQALQMHGLMRYSRDLGQTWSGPHLVEQTVSSFWVYSGMVENSPGQVLCISAVESSSTTCEMSARYLTEGAGVSPFGDAALPAARRVTSRANQIAAVDDFDRPNQAFVSGSYTADGRRWYTDNTASIVDNALQDTSGGPHPHWVKALCTSMEVEAEMQWSGTAGVALVARLQDASNYLMATIESAGGAARIYKVVAGTATQLATATVTCPADVWHRFRFSAVGNSLRFYIEDDLVASVTDATFNTQGGAGVRTGATGATHRVRNWAVRRRSDLNT